jgi:hypothetical protein
MVRKFRINIMSKWLNIKEGSFINLDSIDMWRYEGDEIKIYYANGSFLKIVTGYEDSYEDIEVEISDFNRIKRQIEEYMGL